MWAAWRHEEDIDAFCAQLIVDGSKARVVAGWFVFLSITAQVILDMSRVAQKTWKDMVGI